jgi:hypothetical protein
LTAQTKEENLGCVANQAVATGLFCHPFTRIQAIAMGACSSTPEDATSKEINDYLRREAKKINEQVKLLLLGAPPFYFSLYYPSWE